MNVTQIMDDANKHVERSDKIEVEILDDEERIEKDALLPISDPDICKTSTCSDGSNVDQAPTPTKTIDVTVSHKTINIFRLHDIFIFIFNSIALLCTVYIGFFFDCKFIWYDLVTSYQTRKWFFILNFLFISIIPPLVNKPIIQAFFIYIRHIIFQLNLTDTDQENSSNFYKIINYLLVYFGVTTTLYFVYIWGVIYNGLFIVTCLPSLIAIEAILFYRFCHKHTLWKEYLSYLQSGLCAEFIKNDLKLNPQLCFEINKLSLEIFFLTTQHFLKSMPNAANVHVCEQFKHNFMFVNPCTYMIKARKNRNSNCNLNYVKTENAYWQSMVSCFLLLDHGYRKAYIKSLVAGFILIALYIVTVTFIWLDYVPIAKDGSKLTKKWFYFATTLTTTVFYCLCCISTNCKEIPCIRYKFWEVLTNVLFNEIEGQSPLAIPMFSKTITLHKTRSEYNGIGVDTYHYEENETALETEERTKDKIKLCLLLKHYKIMYQVFESLSIKNAIYQAFRTIYSKENIDINSSDSNTNYDEFVSQLIAINFDVIDVIIMFVGEINYNDYQNKNISHLIQINKDDFAPFSDTYNSETKKNVDATDSLVSCLVDWKKRYDSISTRLLNVMEESGTLFGNIDPQ